MSALRHENHEGRPACDLTEPARAAKIIAELKKICDAKSLDYEGVEFGVNWHPSPLLQFGVWIQHKAITCEARICAESANMPMPQLSDRILRPLVKMAAHDIWREPRAVHPMLKHLDRRDAV